MATPGRLVNPVTNPTGLMSAAGVIYAAADMIFNVAEHHAVFNPSVAVAGVAALAAFFARQVVTPTADPINADGKPLITAAEAVLTPLPVTPVTPLTPVTPVTPVPPTQSQSRQAF